MKTYSIEDINEILKGIIIGNTEVKITAPEQLELASISEITFIGHKKYEKLWETSKACVAIVNEDISIEPGDNRAFIKVKNADIAMSQVLTLFAPPPPKFHTDIHVTAVIDASAVIGNRTKIGAGSVVLPDVTIKQGSSVGALSLVNKDVNPWGIYLGIPAKKIKNRHKDILRLEKKFLKK